MEVDLNKLIAIGKIEKDVTFGDLTLHLETPTANAGKDIKDNTDMVAACVSRITDNSTGKTDQYTTPEQKKILVEKLGPVQGGLISFLIAECTEIANKQQEVIDNLKKY